MNDHQSKAAVDPEFKVGDIIHTNKGKYENQRLLGIGGMGAVYQVTDPDFGSRRWALKTLLPGFGLSRANFERLEDEGKILSGIEHENVVRVEGVLYLADTDPRRPAILMELLEGCTLRNLFDDFGPDEFELEDICQVAIGVCNALAYVHHRPIVHRDVKAENIFIEKKQQKSRVVLIDFGIMRAAERVGAPRKFDTEGHFLGTFANASPEQLLGQEVTRRSDIYSFGTVLYEMAARRPLFPHLTDERAIGQAHIDDKPQDLREVVPHLPGELLDIIMQSLEKNPDDRPKDAYTLLAPFQTLANKLFLDKAKHAGNTTFQRLQTRAVAGERWPVGGEGKAVGAGRGQTVRMVPAQAPPPPPLETTSPSVPPLGGATAPGGRRLANPATRGSLPPDAATPSEQRPVEPLSEVVAEAASNRSVESINAGALEPTPSVIVTASRPSVPPPPSTSQASEPSRLAAGVGGTSGSVQTSPGGPPGTRQRARGGLSAAPVSGATGLPAGPGTDPTSSVDTGRRSKPPVAASPAEDTVVPAGFPVRRTRTIVLSLVGALGIVIATSAVVVRQRSLSSGDTIPPPSADSPPVSPSPPIAKSEPPHGPPTPAPPAAAEAAPLPPPVAAAASAETPASARPLPSANPPTAAAPVAKPPKPPSRSRSAAAPRPSASADHDQSLFEDINVLGK